MAWWHVGWSSGSIRDELRWVVRCEGILLQLPGCCIASPQCFHLDHIKHNHVTVCCCSLWSWPLGLQVDPRDRQWWYDPLSLSNLKTGLHTLWHQWSRNLAPASQLNKVKKSQKLTFLVKSLSNYCMVWTRGILCGSVVVYWSIHGSCSITSCTFKTHVWLPRSAGMGLVCNYLEYILLSGSTTLQSPCILMTLKSIKLYSSASLMHNNLMSVFVFSRIISRNSRCTQLEVLLDNDFLLNLVWVKPLCTIYDKPLADRMPMYAGDFDVEDNAM